MEALPGGLAPDAWRLLDIDAGVLREIMAAAVAAVTPSEAAASVELAVGAATHELLAVRRELYAWLARLQTRYRAILATPPASIADPTSLHAVILEFLREASVGVRRLTHGLHTQGLASHTSLAYLVLALPNVRELQQRALDGPLDVEAWTARLSGLFTPVWAEIMRFCWTLGDGLGKTITRLTPDDLARLQTLCAAPGTVYRVRPAPVHAAASTQDTLVLQMLHVGRHARHSPWVPLARLEPAAGIAVWLLPLPAELERARDDALAAHDRYALTQLTVDGGGSLDSSSAEAARVLAWDAVSVASLREHCLTAQARLVTAARSYLRM